MESCRLSDDKIAQIVDALACSCTVHMLGLNGNKCRGRGLRALGRMLSNPKCRLRSLDLSYQDWGERVLENLFLRDNDNEGDRGRWGRSYSNKSLQELNLSSNNISDDDMPLISLLLRQLTGLQKLDLNCELISDHGLALLAQDRIPSRLRSLRLSDHRITCKSSISVMDLLGTHPELGVFYTGHRWVYSSSKNQSSNSKDDSVDDNGDGLGGDPDGRAAIAFNRWSSTA